jgi:hypothetical protein
MFDNLLTRCNVTRMVTYVTQWHTCTCLRQRHWALRATGLNSVVIGGVGPLEPSIKELQQGQNEAWAALPVESMGYGLRYIPCRGMVI